MRRIFGWARGHKKVIIVLVVVLLGGVFFLRSGNGNGELEEARVERGDVTEEMILSGVIAAEQHAQLAFSSSGKISWIDVVEGQVAKKGQALAKLDTVALNASLQRARADLRAAEANAQEVLDDVKGNDSDETFEEKNLRTAAEVARDKAYEAVIIAEQSLREATLIAPFAGLVTFVENPFAGVNVVAGATQVVIVNPETIHFLVAADQTEVIEIASGEKVKIVLDANDEELGGEVSHISLTTIPGEVGSVYSVKLKFSGELSGEFVYRIGMTGDAHFVLNEKKNVLYVPTDFLKSDSGGDYVLVNEGKDKAYVEVGLEGEVRTEVVGGLSEGARIYD